jgi:outer membrane protein TolC
MAMTIIPVIGSAGDEEALGIDTIESKIIENNIELKRYSDAVDIASYNLEEAEEEADDGGSSYYEIHMNSDYYPKEALMNYEQAVYDYETKVEEQILSGKESYYTYLLLEDEISLQESKIERLNSSLEDLKEKVALGLDKESSVTDMELTIENEKLTLANLNYEKDSLKMTINIMMNVEMTAGFILETASVPFEEYVVEDLEQLIATQLEENEGVRYLVKEQALLEIEKQIYLDTGNVDKYEDTIEDLEDDIENKIDDIGDQKVNVELTIRTNYNSLLNLYDTVMISELKVNSLEYDANAAQKRFELGLITQTELEEASEALRAEQLNLEQAKLDYYLAVEAFKNLNN